MSTKTLTRWSMRRRKRVLNGGGRKWIEYVPPQRGGDPEELAYFWIGDKTGCFDTIDAVVLAEFVDKVRGS